MAKTNTKNTRARKPSPAPAAARDDSEAPARRSSSSSVALGTTVLYREPGRDEGDEPTERPAIVIGVTEGGPAPKGSKEPDDATFLDLVVFGHGDQAAAIVRTVREGDGPGTWAQE